MIFLLSDKTNTKRILAIVLALIGIYYFAVMCKPVNRYDEAMNSRFPAENFFFDNRAEMGQAIYNNEVNKVKQILAREQFDVNELSLQHDGFTYLTYAVFLRGRHEIVKLLLNAGADPNILSVAEFPKYQSPLVTGPDFHGVRYSYPLSIAARSKSVQELKLLLDFGADPNIYLNENQHGNNVAAIIRAINPTYFEKDWSREDWIADIKQRLDLLLSHGADINIKDFANNTLADKAHSAGHIEIIHYLLDKGINTKPFANELIQFLIRDLAREASDRRSPEIKERYYGSRRKLIERLRESEDGK